MLKANFPIFKKNPHLVYLDSAATALKPIEVIKSMQFYYQHYSANIHRGLYKIAEKASFEYEKTRDIIAEFINARSSKEIIFTKGATESLNLVASSIPKSFIQAEDRIIVTISDHHANFIPWQELAKKRHAQFLCVDVNNHGSLNFQDLEKKLDIKTKIVSFPYISNVTGYIFPVEKIVCIVRKKSPDALIILDAAQSISHVKIDVQSLGVDFLVFSGHKLFGPTGVGVLWGKYDLLDFLSPYQYGGDMIESVDVDKSVYQKPPYKFEAGTPNIAGVIGLQASVRFIKNNIDYIKLQNDELRLTSYLIKCLKQAFGTELFILGSLNPKERSSLVSFSLAWGHPHDIADMLGRYDVAVRGGHHCAIPLHTRFGISASVRASMSVYNDKHDIDKLVEGLVKAKKILTQT